MTGKQDDYGYFGKGIDGYVHYKQAFDRNFSENNSIRSGVKQHQTKPVQSSSVAHSTPKDSSQNRFISDCHSKEELDRLHKDAVKSSNTTSFTDPYELYDPLDADSDNDINSYNDANSNKLDSSMMYSDSFYYPQSQQHSQYNKFSKNKRDKDSSRSSFCTIIMLVLVWMGAMMLIMGIPYLLGFLLTGSAGGADSFGGILILVVGAILIFFL